MDRTLQNKARHEELLNLDTIVGGAPTTTATQQVVDAKGNHHVVIATIAILIG